MKAKQNSHGLGSLMLALCLSACVTDQTNATLDPPAQEVNDNAANNEQNDMSSMMQNNMTHHVVLAIRFSDDKQSNFCFDIGAQSTISVEQLTHCTMLAVELTDFGALGKGLCKVDDTGCPADDCFCGGNFYWQLFTVQTNAWISSNDGLSGTKLVPGDVAGLSWSDKSDEQYNPLGFPANVDLQTTCATVLACPSPQTN